jgi:CheY-like chemotaxis protein
MGHHSIALVVDDDPGIRQVYEVALGELGFAPVAAANGFEALRKLSTLRPGLVIVDERMPGISGSEFVRQMRKLGFGSVPIIMVSASRGFEADALNAGASGCLEKPFDIENFIHLVQRHAQVVDATQQCS